MKKRILSLICALALLLTLSPFAAAAEDLGEWDPPFTEGFFQSGDYFYYRTQSGEAWILVYEGAERDLTIPATLDGCRVTTIGSQLFWDNEAIVTITVPEGVTTLQEFAFSGCPNLQTVSLPRTLTECGYGVLANCASLTTIRVDEDCPVLSVRDGVLFDKAEKTLLCYPARRPGTSYAVPEGVTGLGYGAFSNARDLVTVTIPEGVLDIREAAFYGCSSLTTLLLPASLRYIETMAFMNCTALTAFAVAADCPVLSVRDGVLFDKAGEVLFAYPAGRRDTSYTVPDGTTRIAEAAFSDCTALTALQLPDTLKAIGFEAFYNCTGLSSFTIPAGVTDISNLAFDNCTALATITVAAGNADYHTVDGVLFATGELTLLCYPAGRSDEFYAVPEDITAIARGAFSNCAALRTVTMPHTVSEISQGAFSACPALARVDIPPRADWIEDFAFIDCPALTIYSARGSLAEAYAAEYGIPFVATENTPGDVNGDGKVNTADAVLVLQRAAGLIGDTALDTAAADVNADNKINTADAVLILQKSAGLIDRFPAEA